MTMISDKEKLQQLEKEFEEFLYIVSHDFAAPIRHINGFASIIQQENQNQLNSQTDKYLKNISKSSERLDAMLKGLLSLSRINTRPGEKVEISLKGLIEAAWERDLRNHRPEDASLKTADLPSIIGDEDQLHQALYAILHNCIQYRDPEFPLEVEITHDNDDLMHIISIKDNGIGINTTKVERVFKPFCRVVSTTEYPGLGMGLAIAKKVIEHHGGKIAIEIGEIRGTNVIVYLPDDDGSEKSLPSGLIS